MNASSHRIRDWSLVNGLVLSFLAGCSVDDRALQAAEAGASNRSLDASDATAEPRAGGRGPDASAAGSGGTAAAGSGNSRSDASGRAGAGGVAPEGGGIANTDDSSGTGAAGAGGTSAGNGGADGGRSESGTSPPPTPARLTLAPAPTSSTNFGNVLVGQASDRTFVVSNTGQQPSSAIGVQLTPAGSDFSVVGGTSTDCQSAVTTLAGGAACNVRVHFAPTSSTTRAATLAVNATTGGMPPALNLAANGQLPAALSGSTTAAFGDLEIGVTSSAAAWVIRNDGDVATTTPTLTNSNPDEIAVVTNGCATPIAAGSSCTISVAAKASAGGARTGTLSLSAGPAGTAILTISANGAYRVTVQKAGVGMGTVTSSPAGIACGASCSVLVPAGTGVALQARATNGSDSVFAGWSVPACAGPFHDCAFAVNASTTLTATFAHTSNNLVFVSSSSFATNLGGTAAYDSRCNAAATSEGINNLAGTGYIAFISDASSVATARLGSARGWVRMDGKPFADTQSSMFTSQVIWNGVRFDEQGFNVSAGQFSAFVMTGTNSDGTLATMAGTTGTGTCNNWTTALDTVGFVIGLSEEGSYGWTAGQANGCLNGGAPRLLCMGRTKTAAVSPIVTPGKKIWLTNSPFIVGGAQTPNAQCQSDRPAGVTTAAALLATTTRPASAVLDMAANYVRPDGTLVGSGAEIASGKQLESGVWQSGDSVYRSFIFYVWTGQTTLAVPGTIGSTCGNWTDNTQTAGGRGRFVTADPAWWSFSTQFCNDASLPIYCVQTAP